MADASGTRVALDRGWAAARAGDGGAAAQAAYAALEGAPADRTLLAGIGELFDALNLHAEAATAFARAVAAEHADAPPLRLRLGLSYLKSGQFLAALATLERLTADHPGSALAWQALGAVRREADDVSGAAAAFDRVLALKPADPLARLSRAQALADRGRPAAEAFRVALAADPASGAARTGLAAALASGGDVAAAEAVLRERLRRDGSWAEGWATLASLAQRDQGRRAFLAVADEALAAAPHPAAALAALRLLARAGEHRAVLHHMPSFRARWGSSPPLALIEAEALDELGENAAPLFAGLATVDDPTVMLARVRHLLRTGRPDEAASLARKLLVGPASALAWPYLGTAWRLLDDPRAEWLEADPRLVGTIDLGLSAGEITVLADMLRVLHGTGHAPFEQSMRGGTQTEGNLLSREEPELRRLRAVLAAAVRGHVDQMPPSDPTHPVLANPRGRFRFAGSWSVRLTGGGHHVNHVHGEGWYSSACHLVLPAAVPGEGVLTLGEPPRELGTGLRPRRTIMPRAGVLVLFPSIMWHGTTPFPVGERLTVAFDVQPLR